MPHDLSPLAQDAVGFAQDFFSPEQAAEIRRAYERMYRTPAQHGTCDECGSRIVRRVTGKFHGRYTTSRPECERCRAAYWGVKECPIVGVEEFERSLRVPICTPR